VNIIVIPDRTSVSRSFNVKREHIIVGVVMAILVLPAVIGGGTYWLAASLDRTVNPFVDPGYRQAMEQAVEDQRAGMHATREFMENHLDALGMRLGALQAQVSRINAVEQRLASAAGVDLEDFNFAAEPPVGGPADPADSVDINQGDILDAIEEIERQLQQRELEFEAIGFLLSDQIRTGRQLPSGWPVDGGWISSIYGTRTNPISGKKQFHNGVDIPGHRGVDVKVVADGIVTRADKSGYYGWMVEVNHGDGYVTRYGHNESNIVKPGDKVSKGQAIAVLGSTGRSTGPHVHFEVRRYDKTLNPYKYIRNKGGKRG
jgi:murein DD-endopeptidase MepM/ murein hydrolase activator NlpD